MLGDAAAFTLVDEPTESLDEAIARLAAMPRLKYERVREGEAKLLHVRVAILDREVDAKRREAEVVAPSSGVVLLDDHSPWPERVTTACLLNDLASAIRRHLIVPEAASDAIALWVAHTWVYERFDHTPRLAITSPTKRCGKSTLLDILRATCRRPLKADNISASGIFRTVSSLAPLTLLLDEADSFLANNEELRGVLNSGFERSGAVIRVVEVQGEHQAVQFATFAPCALAAIGSIPGTLADRAVPVRLERKTAGDAVTKLRDGRSRDDLSDLGRKLARWRADHAGELATSPAIPAAMGDREGDICVPLLAIADHAGAAWALRARNALLALFSIAAAAEASAEIGVLLLEDLRTIFMEKGAERIPSVELCAALAKMESRPWPEWKAGQPITPKQAADVLKPFKVRPVTYRPSGGKPVKGYQRDCFAEAWQRYLPSPQDGKSERLHGNNGDIDCDFPNMHAVTRNDVLPAENQENGSCELQCYRVTGESAPGGLMGEMEGEL
jgi:putative DNA primase/helicase